MGADGKTRSFTLPSQIADVPGTEGWESMYPYYTRFQPEDEYTVDAGDTHIGHHQLRRRDHGRTEHHLPVRDQRA